MELTKILLYVLIKLFLKYRVNTSEKWYGKLEGGIEGTPMRSNRVTHFIRNCFFSYQSI